ncbi:MAG: aminomethyltransferase family protein [Thermodesulfobacteriota bacterium]
MENQPKTTKLHGWHISQGASMTVFHGWEMPLWYPHGAVAEHREVITHAGLFDTSHMSVLVATGPGARDLLQRCFTRDLDRPECGIGKCLFGAFLSEQGHAVDDAVVCQLDPEAFLITVNAGKGGIVTNHLAGYAQDLRVRISDLTGNVGKLDLQGPLSGQILAKVLEDPEGVLHDMGYYTCKGSFLPEFGSRKVRFAGGIPVLVSRTGYTGEFGFELFVQAEALQKVWEILLEAGSGMGLRTCGLAARDSLRTGAMLPLSGQDFGPWPFINHPWHSALPFAEGERGFTKRFVGDQVLDERDRADYTYAFVGYDPRKVSIHDPAVVLDGQGQEIGTVLTCGVDMGIARHQNRIYSMASPDKPEDFRPSGLCCGFVKVSGKLASGRQVELKDKRRSITVLITDDIRPSRTAHRSMREMI